MGHRGALVEHGARGNGDENLILQHNCMFVHLKKASNKLPENWFSTQEGSVTLRRKPLCRKDSSPKRHFAKCDTSPKYCRNSAKMPKKILLRVFYTFFFFHKFYSFHIIITLLTIKCV